MAPHTLHKRDKIIRLNDKEFTEALKAYNGIPQEILGEQDLMELMLPIIRADMSIIDNYTYKGSSPINCDITTIGGNNDPKVALKDITLWESYTTQKYIHHTLEGDHFFIRSNKNKVLEIINEVFEIY